MKKKKTKDTVKTYVLCSSSVTALWHELHWLPIRQRIVFKLATLTFKAKQFGKPAYLSDLLHEYQPARTLRSSSAQLLHLSLIHI